MARDDLRAKIRSTIKRHRGRQSGYSGFSWQEKITEEKGESKVLTIID
jgi:hypothetical protein